MYLVLKLEGMYRSTAQGLKIACVCVTWGGGHVKNWYISHKDSEGGGISEIKIQNRKKKENGAFRNKAFRNNNNSVPNVRVY